MSTWKKTSNIYKESLERRYRLLEDKTRFIDAADMTDDQKSKVKIFFQKHPNFENKIDWNRKDLTWEDFKPILELEGTTKSSKKKYGLSGQKGFEDLVEGVDYDIIYDRQYPFDENHITCYHIKTFKASEIMARPTSAPLGVTGKWCIAGRNYSPGTKDEHWNSYKTHGVEFFFTFSKTRKYAIAAWKPNYKNKRDPVLIETFNQDDEEGSMVPDLSQYEDKIKEIVMEIHPKFQPPIGPAGGFVFYDKGNDEDGWRYLECAPQDIGQIMWGYCNNPEYDPEDYYQQSVCAVGSTDRAVGSGLENTKKILFVMEENGEGARKTMYPNDGYTDKYAAKACADYELNGYKDWFLPSVVELMLLYEKLHCLGTGDFKDNDYWSSTEPPYWLDGKIAAVAVSFYSGIDLPSYKGNSAFVRPIRRYK